MNYRSKRVILVCLLVAIVGIAGCSAGGGGADATTTEPTGQDATSPEAETAADEDVGDVSNGTTENGTTTANGTATNDTAAGNLTASNATDTGNESDLGVRVGETLFEGQYVTVLGNGTVVDRNGVIVGNVSVAKGAQQNGGFDNVTIARNGTVFGQDGEVVGQVEVDEVCPTADENGYFFDGDFVDVSGASGDVFFDDQNDTFVDLNVLEDDQGAGDDGFQDVRIAQNGTVVNQQGEVVGRVDLSETCQGGTAD